jgi:Uma2 family endonuclease
MIMPELLTESPLTPSSTLGPYRAADYMGLPDEPRCELIYGRLYVAPSPLLLHQVIVLDLGAAMHRLAQRTGGMALVAPMDVTLFEHSVVQPDVLYVSPERRAILQDRIEGAPDLVIEVLSKSTTRRDRGDKLRLYASAGVSEYWIVDPVARQVEFLVNENGRFVVEMPRAGVYRSRAIDQMELDVAALWSTVDARLGPA